MSREYEKFTPDSVTGTYLGDREMSNLAKDTINQFLDGQRDCKEGYPCRSQDPDYVRGFEYQYWCEESRTGMQIQQESSHGFKKTC